VRILQHKLKLEIMETTSSNSNPRIKTILAFTGTIGALLFITCAALHLTPAVMADSIIDFAVHHYFLIGFISLSVAAVCWKMYTSLDEKTETRYRKENSPYTRLNKKKNAMLENFLNAYSKKVHDESQFIKPERVNTLKFTETDVLQEKESILQRQRDLQKAMVLGNSFKQKVILMFKDGSSKKHTITTVWHSNSEHISLKGGIVLPVKSVYKIEF
jgi:hypothetical protein